MTSARIDKVRDKVCGKGHETPVFAFAYLPCFAVTTDDILSQCLLAEPGGSPIVNINDWIN